MFRTPHAVAMAAGLTLTLAVTAAGQEQQQDSAKPLSLTAHHAATFDDAAAHNYTITTEANTFICGAANQQSVDVIVRIFDADGKKLAEFDGPARGPEVFTFEAKTAGDYRVEVAPFEDERGDYRIALRRMEPVASTPEGKVDQLMVAYDDPHTPGGAIAVVKQGEIIFARAYGAANLAYGIAWDVDTRTNIGSTSKQFTAYAIMLLDAQGKLSIDDDVREHMPELPDFGETITIRHLLTHTSGYREFLNLLAMTGRRIDRGDSIQRDEIVRIVQRQRELQNSPGAEWNYNNSAFALLTIIVERVGGQPFPQWMDEHVFTPLGMDDTFVRASPSTIIPNSAMGYAAAPDGGFQEARDLGGAMGAGGIYTTLGDLAKWISNYRTGELGGTNIVKQMSTPYELTNGDSTGYGFGLFIDKQRGLKRIHHGGADTAHRSMAMYFPELDAGVITQSNNAGFGRVADAVAVAFFEDAMESEDDQTVVVSASDAEEFDPASFNPEAFDKFAGRFSMDEMPAFIMTFSRDGDTLRAQATGQPQLTMTPASPTKFKLDGVPASIEFHKGEDGSFDTATLHQNGAHPATRVKDEPWQPTTEQMQAYQGRYYCDELETAYRVAIVDDALVLRVPRFDDIELKASAEHTFTASVPVQSIKFEVNDAGNIVAMIAESGRTRGLRFEPVD